MLNRLYKDGRCIELAVPVGTVSGGIVSIGRFLGIATADRDADGNAPVDFEGAYKLSVKAVNDAGDKAIAVGDDIFYDPDDDPVLTVKKSGRKFGMALQAVTLGATATIGVKKYQEAHTQIFLSDEATGTGAEQSITHNLGAIPTKVLVIPSDTSPAVVGVFTVGAEGTHTASAIKVTVTADKKFRVLAWI